MKRYKKYTKEPKRIMVTCFIFLAFSDFIKKDFKASNSTFFIVSLSVIVMLSSLLSSFRSPIERSYLSLILKILRSQFSPAQLNRVQTVRYEHVHKVIFRHNTNTLAPLLVLISMKEEHTDSMKIYGN